ncbi:hypothetical protein ACTD5D_40885 [Nocardia takedensis]|uniref:hypothetical protein n=1 Tax=Nocardia takedensis TaxID=259390 RepID=UPI003F76C50F
MSGSPISYSALDAETPERVENSLGADGDGLSGLQDSCGDGSCSERALADLAVAEQAVRVADLARTLVVVRPREDRAPGAVLADALAVQRCTDALVAAAAVTDRKHGASWQALGKVAGVSRSTAHDTWSGAETTWNETYFDRLCEALIGGDGGPGAAAALRAARLDDWAARHGTPVAPGAEPGPGRLEPMDPADEARQLDALHAWLLDQDSEPAPELLVALSIRRAEVGEALAAELPVRLARQHRHQAAATRAYARELAADLPAEIAVKYRVRLGSPQRTGSRHGGEEGLSG